MTRKSASAAKMDASGRRDIPTLVKDSSLVEERRQRLVETAVGLFIRKGYHQTTTREIAREAGFSVGSLYEYIKTKEDVLYLVCEAIHREMEERLGKAKHGAGSGEREARSRAEHEYDNKHDGKRSGRGGGQDARPTSRALEAAIRGYFEVCDEMQDSILLIYRETASLERESQRYVLQNEERIAGIFAEILERGVADGSFHFEDPRALALMAHNIVVLGHMWALRRWFLREKFSLDEYTKEQTSLVLGELEGKKRLK